MPAAAAADASAAVTVVLPTPPLPATITTLEAAQKRSRSMVTDATGVPISSLMRRTALLRRAVAAVVMVAGLLALAAGVSSGVSGAAAPVGRRGIDVVQVEGYLDAPNVSLVKDA